MGIEIDQLSTKEYDRLLEKICKHRYTMNTSVIEWKKK